MSKYAEFYADFHGHNEKVTAPKKRCYDGKTEFIKFSNMLFFRKIQKKQKIRKNHENSGNNYKNTRKT